MIEFFKKHKVSAVVIGGVLFITTAYGTCSVDPNVEAIKEEVQKEEAPKPLEKVEEKAPESSEKIEEEKSDIIEVKKES